jgi:D-amino-acid oxidase
MTGILETVEKDVRAGANFSALSGGDANALRWDKLGYGHMMKLAEEHGVEACISKTPSLEYWDEMPSRTKIDSMAEYLQNVHKYFRLQSDRV